MSGADFTALLQTPMDEIKRPPPLPAGTFHGSILGFNFDLSQKKKTPYVRFELGRLTPNEDVDMSALEGVDLTKRSLRKDFYLTEDSRYRVKDFLESCGITVTGRSLGQCIPETLNANVIIAVTQRNSEDGKDIYNDVGDIRGAE